MKKRFFLALAALAVASQASFADADPKMLKQVEPTIDKVMAGYNAKNWKQFYSGWADMMKSVATEQAFTTMYINKYHKEYGTLKSKTLNKEKSSFLDTPGVMNGLITYDAVFSQKKGQLNINVFKEGGVWKVQQVQMNP